MSYKIKGEAEVEIGFGLPRHTTVQRNAYTPDSVGYQVYDTDLSKVFYWDGTQWRGGVEVFKQIPFSYSGSLADATPVSTVAVVRSFVIAAETVATATGPSRGGAIVGPVGGVASFSITKNGTEVGTATIDDGTTVVKFQFASAVTFLVGDTIGITTVVQNGATGIYFTLSVADPDAGLDATYENTNLFVAKSGDTLTGDLVLAGGPSIDLHAATKKYVDDEVAGVTSGATELDGLSDVTIATPATGHVLVHDATDFKNRLLVKADVSDFDDADYVDLTTAQTVTGFKTLSNGIRIQPSATGWMLGAYGTDAAPSHGLKATPSQFTVQQGGQFLQFNTSGTAFLSSVSLLALRSATGRVAIRSQNVGNDPRLEFASNDGSSLIGTITGPDGADYLELDNKMRGVTTLAGDDDATLTTKDYVDAEISGIASGATDLDGLSDVTIATPATGHVLVRDATDFKNRLLVKADVSDFADGDYATAAQGATADTAVQPATLADYVDITTAQTIAGNKTFSGDTTLSGNLTVSGTTTTVDSTNTNIADNIITLNEGETNSIVTAGSAGIEIDRGAGTNEQLIFDESTDTWKLGPIGSLEEIATTGNAVLKTASQTMQGPLIIANTNPSLTLSDVSTGTQTIFFEHSTGVTANISYNSTNGRFTFAKTAAGSTTQLFLDTTGIETNKVIYASTPPTNDNHLTNKKYVDDLINAIDPNDFVLKTGSTMSGNLTVNATAKANKMQIDGLGNSQLVFFSPTNNSSELGILWKTGGFGGAQKAAISFKQTVSDGHPANTLNILNEIGINSGGLYLEPTKIVSRTLIEAPTTLAGDDDATLTTKDYVDAEIAGIASGATELDGLSDVTIATPATGHVLVRDATDFKNRLLVKADVSDFDDADYVDLTTAQTIAGNKTFTDPMVIATGAGDLPLQLTHASASGGVVAEFFATTTQAGTLTAGTSGITLQKTGGSNLRLFNDNVQINADGGLLTIAGTIITATQRIQSTYDILAGDSPNTLTTKEYVDNRTAVESFLVADWTAGVITITQATHGVPVSDIYHVTVYEGTTEIQTEVSTNASGDVTLTIATSAFDGRVRISL